MQIHRKQMKCPHCEEGRNISIAPYISNKWGDPPDLGLECHCNVCGGYFSPKEKGSDKNGR